MHSPRTAIPFFFFPFKTGSHFVAQADLKFIAVFLTFPPECGDFTCKVFRYSHYEKDFEDF